MKRWIIKFTLLLLCLCLFPVTKVYAAERESLEQFAGTDTLWQSIPAEVDEDTLRELLEENDTGSFTQKILKGILSLFSIGIRSGIGLFAKLCALLLFSAIFRAVKKSFGFNGGENALDFLMLLSLSLICFSSLQDALALASSALRSIHAFFLASLPITTVLLTLSGAPSSAATMAASMNFALSAVSTVISDYLAPLLNTLFAFSAANGILDGGLSSLLSFLKKNIKILCILFFTLITASLAIQNALATAADSVAMRSVRFAAGNFIPVVGSLVGESSKTLAAAFSSVKAKCGILCLLVLLYVLLRPILFIAVQKIFLGFAGAVSEIVGETSTQGFLKTLSELLDLLMALLICQSCYLIFYITLFLTNRGGV
ncbi:MAG: hypothetical protein IJC26_08115 [Clostridia bacterium]|nr:hypothetical protein [Clostridia bacterium]